MKSLYNFCGIILLLLAVSGCNSSRLPVKDISNQNPVDYTIIYLIHGDGNYWYHNAEGRAIQADKKVLQEARWVAQHAKKGEVFIFHLKPETQILWVFPRKDRNFFYFRNGKLIYKKNYSPDSKKQSFLAEAKLYHHFHQHAQADSTYKKVMLYFGHEIPAQKGTHYYRSRPQALFNTELFADGLRQFLRPQNDRFALTVLSTCENGTPEMVQTLSPFTETILASPQNLHLSHIDTKGLRLLDQPGNISTAKLADSLASGTFDRLSSFLQTEITLALYDTEAIQSYLPRLADNYQNFLIQTQPHAFVNNVDCADLPFFNINQTNGVKVWYKPSQFGWRADNTTYSGWGCKWQVTAPKYSSS